MIKMSTRNNFKKAIGNCYMLLGIKNSRAS